MLVSWALPKGVPTGKTKNHLAVQTEDHPLDYADFEGTIPKGQYGAGTVSIWDRGTTNAKNGSRGKEVIATLTGAEGGGLGGPRRFALIHTGRADDQWLIHLMDPAGPQGHPGPRAPGRHSGQYGQRHRRGSGRRRSGSADGRGHREGGAETAAGTERAPDASGFSPMLATSGTLADLPDLDWQFELKWDGVRALVIGDATTSPAHQPQRHRHVSELPRADGPVLLAGAGLRRRRRDHRRRPLRPARLRAAAGPDETRAGPPTSPGRSSRRPCG